MPEQSDFWDLDPGSIGFGIEIEDQQAMIGLHENQGAFIAGEPERSNSAARMAFEMGT